MKKYLISSEYFFYDDWNISHICICDTVKMAETLIKEFNENINNFKKTNGFKIIVNKDEFLEWIDGEEYYKNFIDIDGNYVHIFINIEQLNALLCENEELEYDAISHFDFLTICFDKNTIEKKYCNHEEAKLCIKELQYFKDIE